MDIPFPVVIIGLRGLLNLIVLLGIVVSLVVCLPLIVREPAPWQSRVFGTTAILAILAMFSELTVRTLFMGGVSWLHAAYGLLASCLLYFVDGLKPGGWFRKTLQTPPERVGPYLFWASFVGLLLWLRFLQTGITPSGN